MDACVSIICQIRSLDISGSICSTFGVTEASGETRKRECGGEGQRRGMSARPPLICNYCCAPMGHWTITWKPMIMLVRYLKGIGLKHNELGLWRTSMIFSWTIIVFYQLTSAYQSILLDSLFLYGICWQKRSRSLQVLEFHQGWVWISCQFRVKTVKTVSIRTI